MTESSQRVHLQAVLEEAKIAGVLKIVYNNELYQIVYSGKVEDEKEESSSKGKDDN